MAKNQRQTPCTADRMASVQFDEVLEEIGPMGRYQLFVSVLAGLTLLLIGCNHMAVVFVAGLPEYRCVRGGDRNEHGHTASSTAQDNIYAERGTQNMSISTTSGETGSVDLCSVVIGNTTEQCTMWSYDTNVFGSTIAAEWDLVCGQEWRLAFIQSMYMTGVLCGSVFFGNLSDLFGRKRILIISVLVMGIGTCVAAVIPNYWLFVAMRLLVGFFANGVVNSSFVLTMEVLGKNHRTLIGMLYQCCFAIGYIMLAGIAYLTMNFRYTLLIVGLLFLLPLCYWWVLGESPRWLLAQGRVEEYIREVKRAARMNGRPVPSCLFSTEMKAFNTNEKAEASEEQPKYGPLVLLRTPNLRRKTINSCLNWFIVSLAYYVLLFGMGDLAGGPYLNLVLSGVMEISGCVIAVPLLGRVGRRLLVAALHTVAGLACFVVACVPPEYGVVMTVSALIGVIAVASNFGVIYMYSAELFPTVVRTLGVGSGSMCARVGSLIAPFIGLLGQYWGPLPYVLIGTFGIFGGCLAQCLPETLNQPLPESIEDGERFGKNAHK